jgi:hypothetical protein
VINLIKDYLDLKGLVYFLNKLLDKFVTNDNIITNAKIDEICNTVILNAEEVSF